MRAVQRVPEKEFKFGEFKGLYQGRDESLINMSYSPDCQNVDVNEGILSTRKGSMPGYVSDLADMPESFEIKKIFKFGDSIVMGGWSGLNNRWYVGSNLITTDGSTPATAIDPALQVKGIQYLISDADVLILVQPGEAPQKIYLAGEEDYRMADLGGSPSEAWDIALHRERVWLLESDGIEVRTNNIDFSNAYDPEDWSTALETGQIIQNTQDGDLGIAISNLMDNVMMFKTHSLWRIDGDTPGEYSISQVYAMQGAINANAVCSDGNNVYYAGNKGIYKYNGVTAEPILTDAIKDNYAAMFPWIKCVACNDLLYVWDLSGASDSRHIVYDIINKTIGVLKINHIIDVMVDGDYVYYTQGDYICKLDNDVIKDAYGMVDSGAGFPAEDLSENIVAYWFTPKTTLGYPNAVKTLTGLYFTGRGTTKAGAAGGQVKVTVYYNESGTEKTSEKTITLQTTEKVELIEPIVDGRIFRFKFENVDGSAINIADVYAVFELMRD